MPPHSLKACCTVEKAKVTSSAQLASACTAWHSQIAPTEKRLTRGCPGDCKGRKERTWRKELSGLAFDLIWYLASFGWTGFLWLAAGCIFWGFAFGVWGSSKGHTALVWSLMVTARGA